jgi:hypothetical protein
MRHEHAPPPHGAPSLRRLVTSVDVDVAGTHERVRVWIRGALAGDLTVCLGDGKLLAGILMGGDDHAE